MRRFCLLCVSVAALTISACGGGGGGGSATDPSAGAAGPTATGLVPTAPPAGTTLYANAADLRPLIDGAQWQYRGTKKAADGSTQIRYVASVSQKSAGGTLQEVETQVFLGTEDNTLIASSGGDIVVQARDPLGTGSSEVVAVAELRSPVRANDQYTQYERIGLPIGSDVDGDGKADVADVAIYSRVVGNESIELSELSRTVTALKVETTALVRVKKSSDGASLPTSSVVQTQWYFAGVGVVRRTLSAASTSGSVGPLAFEEQLFRWDGVTQGLGALGPRAARLPTSQILLPGALAATTLGDRALVLTSSIDAGSPTAFSLGVFDKRGILQSIVQLAGQGSEPSYAFGSPSLFEIDTNTALLVRPVGTEPGRVRLQRINAAGALQGNASIVTLQTDGVNPLVAWDGQALWIAWLSTGSQVTDRGKLMLQPFAPDGTPLAPAQTLGAPSLGGHIGVAGMSAAAGRLLVSWVHSEFSGVSYRYALVRGSAGNVDVRTLATVQSFGAPTRRLVPVQGSGIAALQWNGPLFGNASNGAVSDNLPRGVVLDASGTPVRSGLGSLDDERLPSSWVGGNTPVLAQAIGDRFVVGSIAYQRAAPELNGYSDFVLAAFVQPGANALAAAATTGTRLAAVSGNLTNIDQFGSPVYMLLWEDRALLIGDNSGRTMTSLFWLR